MLQVHALSCSSVADSRPMSSSQDLCIAISVQSRNQYPTQDATKSSGHPASQERPPAGDLPPVVIREPDVLVAVLQRLRSTESAVCMFNVDRTFQIMLRTKEMDDDDDPNELFFDVCIKKLEDDDNMDDAQWENILELEHEGFYDDDDAVFVMDEWGLLVGDPDRSTLVEAVTCINKLFAMTVCPCNAYFIKDGGDMCPYCQLTCTAADMKRAFCCVCQSETALKHMVHQSCCSQPVHTKCLTAWHARSGCGQCPMCRTVL